MDEVASGDKNDNYQNVFGVKKEVGSDQDINNKIKDLCSIIFILYGNYIIIKYQLIYLILMRKIYLI